MNFSWGVFLAFLLISITFIGLPAFFVGWRRPRLEPQPTLFIVLGSIIIFSAFVAFVPELQRDWFTLILGTLVLGGLGGLVGFSLVVKLAEYLRTIYPESESYPELAEKARRY